MEETRSSVASTLSNIIVGASMVTGVIARGAIREEPEDRWGKCGLVVLNTPTVRHCLGAEQVAQTLVSLPSFKPLPSGIGSLLQAATQNQLIR